MHNLCIPIGSGPTWVLPDDVTFLGAAGIGFIDGALQMTKNKVNPLYYRVRTGDVLGGAWQTVYQKGIKSLSKDTKREIQLFKDKEKTNLKKIYDKLLNNNFKFPPATAKPQPRNGKSPRPLVKATIESRIVQRAILDVFQSHKSFESLYLVNTSYGGLKGKERGVPSAINHAYQTAETDDGKYFIKSDIEGFYTKIPKSAVLNIISQKTDDAKYLALLNDAIQVELDNADAIGHIKSYYPLSDIGLAQGSSLSQLLGNILLYEFDVLLNDRGITCIRYVDDFIIFGSSKKKVEKAFSAAQDWLSQYSMKAYNPAEHPEKASQGLTEKGFNFLGCDVRPYLISPDRKTRKNLIDKVEDALKQSSVCFSNPEYTMAAQMGVVDILYEISNIIKGWGNHYYFCNDLNVLDLLDKKIYELIRRYLYKYKNAVDALSESNIQDRRRLLGVHFLGDSKRKPIVVPKKQLKVTEGLFLDQ